MSTGMLVGENTSKTSKLCRSWPRALDRISANDKEATMVSQFTTHDEWEKMYVGGSFEAPLFELFSFWKHIAREARDPVCW